MEEYAKLRGYEKYNIVHLLLDKLIDMNDAMKEYKLDLSVYKDEIKKIENDFIEEDKKLKKHSFLTETMKLEYESISLSSINKRLYVLTNNLYSYVAPIRKIYLLMEYIEKILQLDDEKYLINITSLSKSLIDSLDSIYTHNNEVIQSLIIKSSNTLYKALKFENSYNKSDFLTYVKSKESSVSSELIGSLLRQEVLSIIKEPVFGEIKLNKEIISAINTKKNNIEVDKKELERIGNKIESINRDIDYYSDKLEDINKEIEKLSKNYCLKKSLYTSLKLSPIIVGIVGSLIAGNYIINENNNSSTRYKTCRVIDYETNEIYSKWRTDSFPENYNKVIFVYEPWEYSQIDKQYRRVKTYYTLYSDDIELNLDDIDFDELEKSKSVEFEYKNKLSKSDNTDKVQILVKDYIYEIDKDNLSEIDVIAMLGSLLGSTILGLFILKLFSHKIKEFDSQENDLNYYKKRKLELLKELKGLSEQLQASVIKQEELLGYEEVSLSELLSANGQNNMTRSLSRP